MTRWPVWTGGVMRAPDCCFHVEKMCPDRADLHNWYFENNNNNFSPNLYMPLWITRQRFHLCSVGTEAWTVNKQNFFSFHAYVTKLFLRSSVKGIKVTLSGMNPYNTQRGIYTANVLNRINDWYVQHAAQHLRIVTGFMVFSVTNAMIVFYCFMG